MTVAPTPVPAHSSSSAFPLDQLADAAPVYLDFAATTPLLPVARSAMVAAMDAGFGNASALHTPGHAAAVTLEDARAAVAALINARPTEIIFTSGGSESNNTITETFRDQAIAVSSIEHSSLLESARHRARRCEELAVDPQGFVQPAADWSPYQLVSVMLANNELGSIQPIADLAQAVHAAGGRFHTDATQALGKIPVDVQALGVDYLTISAHKIGGPIGIGALYVRTGAPFQPLPPTSSSPAVLPPPLATSLSIASPSTTPDRSARSATSSAPAFSPKSPTAASTAPPPIACLIS